MSKSKKVLAYIKLTIPAGKANPSPPIGPALGQKGLNIMAFCKEFNAATQEMEAGTPVPVVITAYEDKSFTFVTKTPPASYYLKQFANVKKGSSLTKKESFVGQITMEQCRQIATIKAKDLNAFDVNKAAMMIAGSAASMGLEVVGE